MWILWNASKTQFLRRIRNLFDSVLERWPQSFQRLEEIRDYTVLVTHPGCRCQTTTVCRLWPKYNRISPCPKFLHPIPYWFWTSLPRWTQYHKCWVARNFSLCLNHWLNPRKTSLQIHWTSWNHERLGKEIYQFGTSAQIIAQPLTLVGLCIVWHPYSLTELNSTLHLPTAAQPGTLARGEPKSNFYLGILEVDQNSEIM